MASKKYNINELKIARLSWKPVLEDALDENQREKYINRKNAVDMYIDGYELLKIQEFTKVNYTNISRLINRCCTINQETGEFYGYTGLLHYNHTTKNINVNVVNNLSKRGLFEALLVRYPSLVQFISDNYFGNKNITLEKNIKITTLHYKFLTECRRLGIQDYEYPFNVESKGLKSLSRYIHKLKHKNEQGYYKHKFHGNY